MIKQLLVGIFLLLFFPLTPFEKDEWEEFYEVVKSKNDDFLDDMRALAYRFKNKGFEFHDNVFQKLREKGNPRDYHYQTRFHILKVMIFRLLGKEHQLDLEQTVRDLKENGSLANDPLVLANAHWYTGVLMYDNHNYDLAIANCLDALEVFEQYFPKSRLYGNYALLGELSFLVMDYDASIRYYILSLENDHSEGVQAERLRIINSNAIGQAHLRRNRFEEAKDYLLKTDLRIAGIKDELWKGINNAYLGHVYLVLGDLEKAEDLLQSAVEICAGRESNVTAYAYHYLGRLYMVKGDFQKSLKYLRHAERLLLESDNPYLLQTQYYLQETFKSLSEYFRMNASYSQADEYFDRFKLLSDSLQYISVLSSQNITKLRMDNEKAAWNLVLAEHEKQRQVHKRNILLIVVIALFIVGSSFLMFAKNKLKVERQLAWAENQKLLAERKATLEQLNMLKYNLMEKTKLLTGFEKRLTELQQQVDVREDLQKISELKILTESDWDEFKKLFERLHPGFMSQIKKKAPDITLAELRLAALIKLQYSSKEMADILGVSPDSVYKTRYRLRSRLLIDNEHSLEQFILQETA